MAGITDLSLSISAFTSDLNDDEIQEAFEKTELNDVKKWSEIFIGDTLYSKRKKELLAKRF